MSSPSRPDERLGLAGGARWFGVYVAVVVDVADPQRSGRVRVQLPWARDVDGAPFEAWCRLVVPMAGSARGVWFVPDVGDEVAVSFEAGDPHRPFVVGSLWNGEDPPPEEMDGGGANNVRAIHSRSGIRIVMDDTSGNVALTLNTPGGNSVELVDAGSRITVRDAGGNRVELAPAGITVDSSAKVTVRASTIDVTAGSITVTAGMTSFSGVVKADAVITNSVVSTSYTPGAGNVW